MILVALSAAGCAGTRGPSSPSSGVGGAEGVAPWEIPPGSLRSQHLFRLAYEGPGASAGLKVALRLETARTFEVRVFDRLGRAVWAAASAEGETLLVDHEGERFCRLTGPVTWAGLEELGPLAPEALPALLLGRVPARPADASWRPASEDFEIHEANGATWRGRIVDGVVSSWTLYEDDQPRWWWVRTERGGAILSQRGAGRQVRWETVAREPLAEPGGLAPPVTYRERCDELASPAP